MFSIKFDIKKEAESPSNNSDSALIFLIYLKYK